MGAFKTSWKVPVARICPFRGFSGPSGDCFGQKPPSQRHRQIKVREVILLRTLTAKQRSSYTPSLEIANAYVTGLRNVLHWTGMLPGDLEPIIGIKIVDPAYHTRRRSMARHVGDRVRSSRIPKSGNPKVGQMDGRAPRLDNRAPFKPAFHHVLSWYLNSTARSKPFQRSPISPAHPTP